MRLAFDDATGGPPVWVDPRAANLSGADLPLVYVTRRCIVGLAGGQWEKRRDSACLRHAQGLCAGREVTPQPALR